MEEKKYNIKDLTVAYFNKKSKIYRKSGFRYAKPLKRNVYDYQDHFFAFLIDLNVCLLPVYIWVLIFLLILCGIVPPRLFDLLFYVMFGLLFVTSMIFLGFFTARSKGQSFGCVMMDLKFVKRSNNQEAPALNLILRQLLGFGLPLMIGGYFFQIFGIVAWWIFNGIFVLLTPNQQTLMDLIFGLRLVHEPPLQIQFEQKKKQEIVLSPIDLHIRSNYSDDGYYDVEEIFKQAKMANMEVISITDHNCARANAAAVRFAHLYDIQYIPGVELDVQYRHTRLRLLGYYIDWTNEAFDVLERESLTREKEMSLQRVRLFEDYSGIHIDVDSLMNNSRFQTITPDDITQMIFNNERVRNLPFVNKYIEASHNDKEAMEKFKQHIFGKNGPCYVRGQYPQAQEIIQMIHDAQGIVILSGWNMDHISDDMIDELMMLGVDGIEVFSPAVHSQTMTNLLRIAQKHKAFISCGSDYHGPNKPSLHLGQTHCPQKALPLIRILTKAA